VDAAVRLMAPEDLAQGSLEPGAVRDAVRDVGARRGARDEPLEVEDLDVRELDLACRREGGLDRGDRRESPRTLLVLRDGALEEPVVLLEEGRLGADVPEGGAPASR